MSLLEYLWSMLYLMISFLLCQSGEETAAATAERLFHQGSIDMAADLVNSTGWETQELWNRAGLILEMCGEGFSVELSVPTDPSVEAFSGEYRVEAACSTCSGDSLRLAVPVPSSLPWQTAEAPRVFIQGLEGGFTGDSGWVVIEGVSSGLVSVVISAEFRRESEGFPGREAAGADDALLAYPGEDPFLDRCLWPGGPASEHDGIYLESVTLARGEPNPMGLLERCQARISPLIQGSMPVDWRILDSHPAVLALEGSMDNSAGAVYLGVSILRRWGIPAYAAPGRFAEGSQGCFVLFAHVKPFGWMALTPVPGDFVVLGSQYHPRMRSWPSGVPGLTAYGETRSPDGLWSAIPAGSGTARQTVEITPL